MSSARQHAEWRRLIEISGPFLSLPVLAEAFPQGLDAHDPEIARSLRQGHEEWQESPSLHNSWVRFILTRVLGHPDEVLLEGQGVPTGLRVTVGEHRETLSPDIVLANPDGGGARILVKVLPPGTSLDKPLAGSRWKESPAGRMAVLLRGAKVRLGIVTNGELWTLVDAPRDGTAGFATWRAELWLDEPLTLRAFRMLLGPHRLFGVAEKETLEALLAQSAEHQQEVTEQLGRQVRRAVEILVQALDRSDRDSNRTLLADTSEREVYDAAVTFMMRLVFLFCAEERGLFPLDLPQYAENYAASTLRDHLREAAEQAGEEVLERRTDAWQRLLATFRAIHGGVDHEEMALPPYGGHLFDPDRYPFLEGRSVGTPWRATAARPLPISNRTVLHLLEALQLVRDSKTGEAQRVSFRALDIEQIGHVYEGLLDHTVKRASEPMVSLKGKEAEEPEVAVSWLESATNVGPGRLAKEIAEVTKRSEKAIAKDLALSPDAGTEQSLLVACENDGALAERLRPFASLVRRDAAGLHVVISPSSLYVTAGSDRRNTGTHYTPRSLTEPIVKYTLEPLSYVGPSEGKPEEDWTLKSARELLALKVCDMACGSGAFLVQACRFLSERLVESWEQIENANPGRVLITPEGDLSDGHLAESILPVDDVERLSVARRLVADRCLYGVDINPMAVEMAKLSLWLVTLQRNAAFTFLDHCIRCGDSLLGISDIRQVETLSLDMKNPAAPLFLSEACRKAIQNSSDIRRRLEGFTVKDIRDADAKGALLRDAEDSVEIVRVLSDVVVGLALARNAPIPLGDLQRTAEVLLTEPPGPVREEAIQNLRLAARRMLDHGKPEGAPERRPFHWPIEFPEINTQQGGVDALVGNPPFMGGLKLESSLGADYRRLLVSELARGIAGVRGTADLCAYFLLRTRDVLSSHGRLGFLATNTIAQGDSREVGLEQLVGAGYSVVRAIQSRRWPGEASLEIAHLWMQRGTWAGRFVLDDKPVTSISPLLAVPGKTTGVPKRLSSNSKLAFQGSIVLGMGFVLEPSEAALLLERDPLAREVLFPYLNGDDLNSRPDRTASRWVIDFHDWPLARAAKHREVLSIVAQKVKAEREQYPPTSAWNRSVREYWWRLAARRPELYEAVGGFERVLVCPIFTKWLSFAWVDRRQVFMNKLVVFSLQGDGEFATLQSGIHESWARHFSSTLETRLQYSPTNCFETFPFPSQSGRLNAIGSELSASRDRLMSSRGIGLTAAYNLLNSPNESALDVATLRGLHVEMDRGVAAAYGWTDLDLGHGFHETKQGVRFTIGEPARREVLDRLLELNHQRFAEESKQGLHEKGAKAAKKRGAASKNATLLDLDEET